MAAAISATQARNPITLRNIRAVINRCPMSGTPYRAAPALPGWRLPLPRIRANRMPLAEFPPTVAWSQQKRRNLVTMIIFDALFFDRGKQMIIYLDSWEAGYGDGLLGRPSQCTDGLDRFSYSSGYVQARASRAGTRESRRLHYTRSL